MLRRFYNRVYLDNLDTDSIIEAIQPELDSLQAELQAVFNNSFAATATATGLLKWEIILGIVADPTTEPLDFRRGRVLGRLASNIPFTERTLHEIMDSIMGAGSWTYELDYRNYKLDITSLRPGKNWLAEMRVMLDKIVPANLVFFLHIYYQSWQGLYEDKPTWQSVYDKYATWQEVMEGIEIG